MPSFGESVIQRMILFVAIYAKAHGERSDASRHSHRCNISMTVTAYLFVRTLLLEYETLNMALVIESHIIRQVMYFFPWDRLACLPVFKQLLNTRRITY